MCHVQRVVNTCGHRNDHVSLSCRFAKAGHNLAVPIGDPNFSLSHTTSTTTTSTRTSSMTTTTTVTTITTTTNTPATSSSSSDSASQSHSPTDSVDTCTAAQHHGFHAYTEPYCIYAAVRTLDSPAGFMCMVEGCGRAD